MYVIYSVSAFLSIGSESKANFLCVPESKFAMFDKIA